MHTGIARGKGGGPEKMPTGKCKRDPLCEKNAGRVSEAHLEEVTSWGVGRCVPTCVAKTCAVLTFFSRVAGSWGKQIQEFARTGYEAIRQQKSTVGGSPGPKIAHCCKNWQFLLFGQWSFQKYFFWLPKQVLVQGHTLRLLDEAREPGISSTQNQKTRTVSTC